MLLKSRSLSLYIFLYAIATITVMAFIYSSYLLDFFADGLRLSSSIAVIATANEFADLYQQRGSAVFPDSLLMHGALSYAELPQWVQAVFGQPPFEHQDFVSTFWTPSPELGMEPGQHYLHLYVHQLYDGKQLFIYYNYTPQMIAEGGSYQYEEIQRQILPLFFGAILAVSLLTLLLVAMLHRSTLRLSRWAARIGAEPNLGLPHFHLKEHQAIAQTLHDSVEQVVQSTESQKRFLRYSSHELRTPIAVLRSNLQLINKLDVVDKGNVMAKKSWQRVERATHNMQHIVDTLLWLHGSAAPDDTKESVALDRVIDHCVADHRYLLDAKQVDVVLDCKPCTLITQPVLASVVINNLVRNAFQHTFDGRVDILLTEQSLVISNPFDTEANAKSETGYGLGLQLVKQLCERFGWGYRVEIINIDDAYNRYQIEIKFN